MLSLRIYSFARYGRFSDEGKKATTDLAGGYFGCLLQLCGDLDYNARWLGLPRWSNHAKPCALCMATFRGPLSWTDNRPSALWISSCLTIANWREYCETECEIFDLPGMSGLSVAMDYTHNMFLGWLQYLYGSVFYLLVHVILPGEALENLTAIGEFITNFQDENYTEHKYSHRLDKLSMFMKKSGYPKLRGKAVDIRGLDKTMLALWSKHMHVTDRAHRQIRLVLDHNVRIASVKTSHSRWRNCIISCLSILLLARSRFLT